VEEISPALLDSFLRYDWPRKCAAARERNKAISHPAGHEHESLRAKEQSQSTTAGVGPVKPRKTTCRWKDGRTRAAENAEKELVLRVLERDQLESQAGRAAPEHLLQGALNKLKRWPYR